MACDEGTTLAFYMFRIAWVVERVGVSSNNEFGNPSRDEMVNIERNGAIRDCLVAKSKS